MPIFLGRNVAKSEKANSYPSGTHKIEIQKSGYKTWARTWQVLANSPVKIEVELEKI